MMTTASRRCQPKEQTKRQPHYPRWSAYEMRNIKRKQTNDAVSRNCEMVTDGPLGKFLYIVFDVKRKIKASE